jgi:hypothetical protein
MRHEEFRIGMEFWGGGRRWRCTDIGTRVVVGVCLEPHEVVTVTGKFDESGTTTTGTIAADDSWIAGHLTRYPRRYLTNTPWTSAVFRPMRTTSRPVGATLNKRYRISRSP